MPGLPRSLLFFGEWKSGKKLHLLPRHKNPGLEIVLIDQGELRWEIEGREFTLGPDTLFYTFPWQAHGGVEDVQPSSEILYFCVALAENHHRPTRKFRFDKSLGFSRQEEKLIAATLTGRRSQALAAGDDMRSLFHYFFRSTSDRGVLAQSRTRESLKLLILESARLAETQKESDAPRRSADRRVRDFSRALAHRSAEPWSLKSMEQACGLGRTRLAELLKKQVGDKPITFINRLRIQKAEKLLRQSDKTITEIAFEVGFNSSQYFATVFKQFTGMKARNFRVHQPE